MTKTTARTAELRDLSVDDLRQRVRELDESLFRMRMQKAMGQLESPIAVRTSRRELARMKTIIREKERA